MVMIFSDVCVCYKTTTLNAYHDSSSKNQKQNKKIGFCFIHFV